MKNKILGFVPARSDSKSIPGKNIVKLFGKPLIHYSIEVALKSKYIDRVVMSSDDEKILNAGRKFEVDLVKRPKNIAQDKSPMDLAIKHTLSFLEKRNYYPEIVVLLQPTSPLRTLKTMDLAIKEFLTKGKRYDSLIPLAEIGSKIGNIYKGRYKPLGKVGKQRQELKIFL